MMARNDLLLKMELSGKVWNDNNSINEIPVRIRRRNPIAIAVNIWLIQNLNLKHV